jgi:hypothetical protein
MKNLKILVISTLALFLIPVLSMAQTQEEVFNAFRKGNVETIVSMLDEPMEFCLDDESFIIGKKDARKKIGEFFNSNPPSSIELLHSGNSKSQDSRYYICSLGTTNINWRLYIYFGSSGGSMKIQELRLDKDS